MGQILKLIKLAFHGFSQDHAPVLSAAIAYYGTLSLAPLMLLIVAVTGFLGHGVRAELIARLSDTIGPNAAKAISQVMAGAAAGGGTGIVATIIAGAAMLFGVAAFAAQWQFALNQIWDVEATPSGLWSVVRKRLLGLGLFIIAGFILGASLIITTFLQGLIGSIEGVWQALNITLDVIVFTTLFALLFEYLPAARIRWRDAWVGAFITAILFEGGKYGISFYLAFASISSVYGAAGSLIVILLWIYYSSLIMFLGAELTQAYARIYGHGVRPDAEAQRIRSPEPVGET